MTAGTPGLDPAPTPGTAPAIASPQDAPSPAPPARGPCCLLGCGCGCIFPLVAFLAGLGLFFWVIDPMVVQLRAKPSLPDLPRPGREERWNLADKVRQFAAAPVPGGSLALTAGEANALLQRWSPAPAGGFALDHAWILPETDKAILLLQGSGFWMRSLAFAVELSAETPGGSTFPVRRILINGLELTEGWGFALVRSHLATWVTRTTGLSPADLEGGRLRFTFGPDRVTISGDILSQFLFKGLLEADTTDRSAPPASGTPQPAPPAQPPDPPTGP